MIRERFKFISLWLLVFSPILVAAQTPVIPGGPNPSPFFGGIPTGDTSAEAMKLSLSDAVTRGLQQNLGAILADQGQRSAEGSRKRALAELLPNIKWDTFESSNQINLASFGFQPFPGTPQIVGPFSVFDTRVYLTEKLLSFKDIHAEHAAEADQKAAQFTYTDARDFVVLVCSSLYLQAVASQSRIEAANSQLRTAEGLYQLSLDLKKSGIAPGIDALRSQVELQTQQQRLISLQNDFERRKLDLARAIGLPLAQSIVLTDPLNDAALPAMTLEEAIQTAYQSRSDFKSASAKVHAAEELTKSAKAEAYPSLDLDADYGTTGEAIDSNHGTYRVAAGVSIPIFQGGRTRGKVLQADAALQQRKAEREDLRVRVEYEVRSAFLDLAASSKNIEVARGTLDLANQQLTQAQDRFQAGVTNNIEVLQAQQALSAANDNYISSLFVYNLSKGTLARALGMAEQGFRKFILGEN